MSEEISRQPNIGSVMWLVTFLCRFVTKKKKKSKWDRKKHKRYSLKSKRAVGNVTLETQLV